MHGCDGRAVLSQQLSRLPVPTTVAAGINSEPARSPHQPRPNRVRLRVTYRRPGRVFMKICLLVLNAVRQRQGRGSQATIASTTLEGYILLWDMQSLRVPRSRKR